MKTLLLAAALAVVGTVAAAPLPYDEHADARSDIRRAFADAKERHVPVLIIFGANWCEDCRVLDHAFHTSPNEALISKSFSLVKVDVGEFDRNLDVAEAYRNPIRIGIPAAAVVSADGRILYSTQAGELANARQMSPTGIFDFFTRVAAHPK